MFKIVFGFKCLFELYCIIYSVLYLEVCTIIDIPIDVYFNGANTGHFAVKPLVLSCLNADRYGF